MKFSAKYAILNSKICGWILFYSHKSYKYEAIFPKLVSKCWMVPKQVKNENFEKIAPLEQNLEPFKVGVNFLRKNLENWSFLENVL